MGRGSPTAFLGKAGVGAIPWFPSGQWVLPRAVGLSGEDSNYYKGESYEYQVLFINSFSVSPGCLCCSTSKAHDMTVMGPHTFHNEFKTVACPCFFSKSPGTRAKGGSIQKGRVLVGGQLTDTAIRGHLPS